MPDAAAAPLPPPRDPDGPYRICLVCLGNICRSPMAEAVLRSELAAAGLGGETVVDSAGTGDWHVGEDMERHARSQLARRGYDGTGHRARQIEPSWLARRDLVLAMDRHNLADLRRMAARSGTGPERILLFGEAGGLPAARGGDLGVPDPYGGGPEDFGTALGMIVAGSRHIAARLAGLLAGRARA